MFLQELNEPQYLPSLEQNLWAKLADKVNPDAPDLLGVTDSFLKLVKEGWRAVYSALFDTPVRAFVGNLAPHHAEAIEWHWNSRLALLRGEKPDYWSYFPIWSRGHMKSTVARRIAVVDALISVAFKEPAYILYVSRNKKMAEKHAKSIEGILTSSQVKRFCPGIAKVKENEQGNSKGWTGEFIYTSVDCIFHFAGLEEGLAGGNVDDVRPTFILPDDIDGRERSPVIGENRFQKLTTEVLPMRQHNTLQFWAQNLISRYTAMYRIHSGQERVLTDRKPTMPIPAIIGLKTKVVKMPDGMVRDIIIEGTPTWEWFGLDKCQETINTIGLPAFLRECQHEVDQSDEGLMAHNYVDGIHVISISQFARIYKTRSIPETWNKWAINDWARTKTDKHANVAAWITVSSQNSPLPGMTFVFHPMSFKANAMPEDVGERILTCLTPYAYRRVTWAKIRRDTFLRINAAQHTDGFQAMSEYQRGVFAKAIKKHSVAVLKRFTVRKGVMGHSDDNVLKIYRDVFGLQMHPVNPGKFGGMDDLNAAMKVVDDEPHPFKPGELGYTRWFIVVPDDKTQEPQNIDGVLVYPPKPYNPALRPHDLHDDDLIRHQMKNWRMREPKLTETGEQIDEPLKISDDFGQALQFFYFKKLLKNVKLTRKEKVAAALPEGVNKLVHKKHLTMGEQLALEDALDEAGAKINREFDPRVNSLGEDISPINQEPINKFTQDINGFDEFY